MAIKPVFGNWLSVDKLNSLENYVVVTMKEPWEIIKNKIESSPADVIYNMDMDYEHLREMVNKLEISKKSVKSVIGIGGGTACDTAKFIAYWAKENLDAELDLYLAPSIISVDAFLCSSIAVRVKNKVNYIGESNPKEILIDYDLIQSAPKFLNRAGVSDTISITSALGDWKLERDEVNGRFDKKVFNEARKIAVELMDARKEIRKVSKKGIKALVDGFYKEVVLCEAWGNARPEEGSEHFLAYCLEAITHDHYIHGNLIGMNILISLFLQEEYAEFSVEEIRQFFDDIKIEISPQEQKITDLQLKKALSSIQQYVIDEQLQYSIYTSPQIKLTDEKISEILNFIK